MQHIRLAHQYLIHDAEFFPVSMYSTHTKALAAANKWLNTLKALYSDMEFRTSIKWRGSDNGYWADITAKND